MVGVDAGLWCTGGWIGAARFAVMYCLTCVYVCMQDGKSVVSGSQDKTVHLAGTSEVIFVEHKPLVVLSLSEYDVEV